ncbi:MAG: type III restriction endonuclease subunit R [Pseudomonadota bacterium]
MLDFQVESPIQNSPYEEPTRWWRIVPGETPQLIDGRRPAAYYWRKAGGAEEDNEDVGTEITLIMVNRIRERVRQWRADGHPGASRLSLELLAWWQREGRAQRLFFAQLESAITVIFLTEARPDYLQGIDVAPDRPTDRQAADGTKPLMRWACKMATGSGKTTVMGMLAAWTILNKVGSGGRDARFADFVLVVCPNVTIRSRLGELDPARGDASLYRTRDLVPVHLMGLLTQGRVLVRNWHVFDLQDDGSVGGDSARVVRRGRELREKKTVRIADKATTARGTRYMTLEAYRKAQVLGLLEVVSEATNEHGVPVQAEVVETRYVESDAKWLKRVLEDGARKRNIMVFNDEAHHAYRLGDAEEGEDEDDDGLDAYYREATIWVEGLDRINRLTGVGRVLDFSATPYYLGRVGNNANRPFPWVVSDFGLMEAIESGLTKIPQFAARDLAGEPIPGYFNIWRWILPQLKASERGGRKQAAKPEAILRHAFTPLVMLGGLWQQRAREWAAVGTDDRPPVFIVVCKNIKLSKLVFDWLAMDDPPPGVPKAGLANFLNSPERENTIRVDSTVEEDAWMRHTLDTVGRRDWPRDTMGRPLYPEGFVELAAKLKKPLHPPGRDVRAIVSVGMLTEGWDCNTVTHIVGLRPFMSQLLCEQVVGRGLRRAGYEPGDDGKLPEEIAQIFGVPFQVVPFKAQANAAPKPQVQTWRVRALPERAPLEIRFPRVDGYIVRATRSLDIDWDRVDAIQIDPTRLPVSVEMKAGLPAADGTPLVGAPGRMEEVTLAEYRLHNRLQTQAMRAAHELMREYARRTAVDAAVLQPLFGHFVALVLGFVQRKALAHPPAQKSDVFLAPNYSRMQEILLEHLTVSGTEGLRPRCEQHRPVGSTADVDYSTRKEPMPVLRSHLNFVVADSQWERIAATVLDTHPKVESFVKNSGLGFAIPYTLRGTAHDYLPDFVVKLDGGKRHLIVEIKGLSDEQSDAKKRAAQQWCEAVSGDGSFGRWDFLQIESRQTIPAQLASALEV